jgi:hypothetical protein
MPAIVSGREESVTRRTPSTERVGTFSDGLFAMIITIMVRPEASSVGVPGNLERSYKAP